MIYIAFYLICLFYCFNTKDINIKCSRLLVFTVFYESFIAIKNFPFFTFEIEFGALFQLITFIFFVYVLFKYRLVSASNLLPYLIFLLCVLIGISNLYFLGPPATLVPGFGILLDDLYFDKIQLEPLEISISHLLRIIKLFFLFPFAVIIGKNFFDQVEFKRLLLKITIFYLTFLFVEFISKNFFPSEIWLNFASIFLNNQVFLEERSGFIALSGLAAEPSHLAYAFILPLSVFLYSKKQKK